MTYCLWIRCIITLLLFSLASSAYSTALFTPDSSTQTKSSASYTPSNSISYTSNNATSYAGKKTAKQNKKYPSQKSALPGEVFYNNLAPFSAINISGPVKVIINGSQDRQSVVIKGPPVLIAPVYIAVTKNTLIITAPQGNTKKQTMLVTINTPRQVNMITAKGNSYVLGRNISSSELFIISKDHAKIDLSGRINLRSIQNDSNQDIRIGPINSRTVMIYGRGAGHIILSGKTESLDTKLGALACLEAQRLQAYEVHVLTEDRAIAYVWATQNLFAFAGGASNIYYFNPPKLLMRDSHSSGNILRLLPERDYL